MSDSRLSNFWRSSFRRACLPALSIFLACAAAAGAQDTPIFRIQSNLINLWVNVTDQNGAIVGDLGQADFKVAEDGRPQEIKVFERQSEQPLNIVLAIDTSESTFKDRSLEQNAARKFVHALLRPQDQISVLQFATSVSQLAPFTNDVKRIDRALNSLKSGEASAVYETIYLGSDQLATQAAKQQPGKSARRVLVIVSDGGDTAKSTDYEQALEQALRAEAMIYSIIDVPIAASAGRDLAGEHALITLAEQTGGKSFYVEAGNLSKAFDQVSEALRTQYLIGYYPHNQAPGVNFHRISVTLPRASADAFNIRYRAGYFSDPPATQRRRVPVD